MNAPLDFSNAYTFSSQNPFSKSDSELDDVFNSKSQPMLDATMLMRIRDASYDYSRSTAGKLERFQILLESVEKLQILDYSYSSFVILEAANLLELGTNCVRGMTDVDLRHEVKRAVLLAKDLVSGISTSDPHFTFVQSSVWVLMEVCFRACHDFQKYLDDDVMFRWCFVGMFEFFIASFRVLRNLKEEEHSRLFNRVFHDFMCVGNEKVMLHFKKIASAEWSNPKSDHVVEERCIIDCGWKFFVGL